MSIVSTVRRLGPWAVLEYLVSPVVALISTPLIIHYLGLEKFGLWVAIISAAGFSVALSSGVSVSLGRYISAHPDCSPRLVRCAQLDALHVMAVVSLFSAITAVLLVVLSGVSVGSFGSDPVIIFSLLFLSVVFDCFDTTFSSILKGELKYARSAKAEVISRFVQFIALCLCLFAYPYLLCLVFISFFGSLIRMCLRYLLCDLSWINHRVLISHRIERDSPLLSSIGWASLQNLGAALYTTVDRLIVSQAYGPTTLALYAVASQLTNQIQAIFGAAFSVLSNSTARAVSHRDRNRVISNCLSVSGVVAVFSVAAYTTYYAVSDHLFSAWLGEVQATKVMPLVIGVVLAAAIQTIVVPVHFFLIGLGEFKLVAVWGLVAGAVSVSLLWLVSMFFDAQIALVARSAYGLVLLSYFFFLFRVRAR